MIKILADSCIIMFMKTIYMHVGPEKTGTKSIQKLLRENKKQLEILSFHYEDRYKLFRLANGKVIKSLELNKNKQIKMKKSCMKYFQRLKHKI